VEAAAVKRGNSKRAGTVHRRYHEWLMEQYPCVCGCGRQATHVHHPLDEHPEQGTRRNHEYVVPMWWECHDRLHRHGSDEYANAAAGYRREGIDAGLL
jgi:hypothetical protein